MSVLWLNSHICVAADQALKEAQRRGIAEADPSLDVDGFDTANKLVLIANALGLHPSNGDEVGMYIGNSPNNARMSIRNRCSSVVSGL